MIFSRRFSGLWGVASSSIMAITVVTILVLLELPSAVIWGSSLLAGTLVFLQVISALRGSTKRSQEYSTFEYNTLGSPVAEELQAPCNYPMPFDSTESVLVWCAPVMQVASGVGDLSKGGARAFLGKGKTTDAENVLILTQKRLLFLMIGPDALQRFSASSRVSRLLQTLPGNAYAKRRMLWQAGASEVRYALSGLLTEESLENLSQKHYSFTIPLDRINAVNYSFDKRMLKLQLDGLNLHYCFKIEADLTSLIAEMTKLGIATGCRREA